MFWYSLLSWCLSSGACYASTQVSTTAYVEVSIDNMLSMKILRYCSRGYIISSHGIIANGNIEYMYRA